MAAAADCGGGEFERGVGEVEVGRGSGGSGNLESAARIG